MEQLALIVAAAAAVLSVVAVVVSFLTDRSMQRLRGALEAMEEAMDEEEPDDDRRGRTL